MDDRVKIVEQNIGKCLEHREHLSEWEIGFVTSLNDYENKSGITNRQFNKLHDIVRKIDNQ